MVTSFSGFWCDLGSDPQLSAVPANISVMTCMATSANIDSKTLAGFNMHLHAKYEFLLDMHLAFAFSASKIILSAFITSN